VRDAGANLGVATSLELQLHPIETVLSGSPKYPLRRAKKILIFLDDFALIIPPNLFVIAAVLPHPGERMLDVKVVWTGKKEKGERALRAAATHLPAALCGFDRAQGLARRQRGTYDFLESIQSSHRRGGHFKRMTGDIIDINEHSSNAPHGASGITMMCWQGPWCAKPHDNAFGFRQTGFEY
jgi:hypothetical protein